MPRKLTQAQFDRIKKERVTEKIKEKKAEKAAAKKTVASTSSPEMQAAVRAAEAATLAAQAAKDMAVSVTEDNKKFMTSMVEVMQGNQVIKLKINRNKDKMMNSVDIVRSSS